ncbi:MAG: MFS transporter [Planctomycetota bacterium]
MHKPDAVATAGSAAADARAAPDRAVAQLAAAPAVPPAPPVRFVLAGHVLFIILYSTLFANTGWLIPMLVRLNFGSSDLAWRDWQTTLVTAALPTLMVLTIFWNELLRRMRLRDYLLLFWVTAAFPLACMALARNYWELFACHLVATAGVASFSPVHGRLLKHFYSDARRGRAYAIINAVGLASGLGAAWAVGSWLEADPTAFRWYLPSAALVQLAGVVLLIRLAHASRIPDEPDPRRLSWRSALEPVVHMGALLKSDRTFMRYERAFMTYGAAFMLCDSLLPVLATTRLGMSYEDYAHSTQVVLKLVMLAITLPTGWLNDRYGPVRTSGLAFAVLVFYPLGLLAAGSAAGLAGASVIYGIGLAGVMMGWMLGPVALAGSPEKVPQYVAIHATLVGVRGVIFQGLGMLLYKLTGGFTCPLLLAAAAFAWAAWQMSRLHGEVRSAIAAAHVPLAPLADPESAD